jgi:serine/threonine-protein kinase
MAEKQPPDPPSGSTRRSASSAVPKPQNQLASDKTVISQRLPYGDHVVYEGDSSRENPREALLGRQLLHFVLEEFIGGGGMGLVFRGTDLELGRPVAVKVLTSDNEIDEEMVRRFRQEAQSTARLNHRNIAQVYYVGEDAGWNFIAFEFVEGENVRDEVMRRGVLPVRLAIDYVVQIAAALEHAHQRGVIHRDIKPSNIVITPEGQAKLVDMGLARLNHMGSGYDDLTASGVTLGTFDYISPEQGRDPRGADIRSDLYSLGCTLYFMLTGQPPFPAGTVLQKLLHHANTRVTDPRQLRADLPAELVRIVMKLLAKSPKRRYQHPRDLCLDLMQAAQEIGLSVSAHPDSGVTQALAGAQQQRRREQGRLVLIPIFATILLALGTEVLFSRHTESTLPPFTAQPAVREIKEPRLQEPTPENTQERMGAESTEDGQSAATRTNVDSSSPNAMSTSSESSSVLTSAPPETQPNPTRISDPSRSASGSSSGSLPATSAVETPEQSTDRSLRSDSDETVARSETSPSADDPAEMFSPMTTADREPFDSQQVRHIIVTDIPAIAPTSNDIAYVATLPEAIGLCEQHREAQTIELQFDGRVVVRPFTLNNLDITIRAAKGHNPVLEFRPAPSDNEEVFPQMIRVTGGNVRFEGVHLLFRIPHTPILRWNTHWSLILVDDVELLKFSQCWLSMIAESKRHDDVAQASVIQLANEANGPTMPNRVRTALPADIILQDCIVQAYGDILHSERLSPVRFSWSNGLAATTGHVVKLGTSFSPMSLPAQPEANVVINFDRLTAYANLGLCQLAMGQRQPAEGKVTLACTNSLFLLPNDAALVEQVSWGDAPDDPDLPLDFSGQHNYYRPENYFLRRVLRESNSPEPHEEAVRFEAWQRRLGQTDRQNQLAPLPRNSRYPSPLVPESILPTRVQSEFPIEPPSATSPDEPFPSQVGFDLTHLPADSP